MPLLGFVKARITDVGGENGKPRCALSLIATISAAKTLEVLLAERGIVDSHELIRLWCNIFWRNVPNDQSVSIRENKG